MKNLGEEDFFVALSGICPLCPVVFFWKSKEEMSEVSPDETTQNTEEVEKHGKKSEVLDVRG